jgi:16S rRNA (cytosine967-C5)-methyltransferase
MLIYCVCSLEREEGEDQGEWVSTALPNLRPDPIRPEELAGLPEAVTSAGTIRTHPGLRVPGEAGGTLDGFFIARFRHVPVDGVGKA